MKHHQLGQSPLFVSEVGLGCMTLGTDSEAAERLVHKAIDLGANFFDTADLYNQGRNEEIVGAALKGKRHSVILASKVGNRFTSGVQGWTWDPSPTHIRASIEQTLRRLQTDYLDLYQIHGGTMEDPIDDIIDTMNDLQAQGLIRAYGISSIRPNVIRAYVEKSQIVSVMMQYSLLDRRPEEIFPLLEQQGVSVIARGPLASGILTDHFPDEKLPEQYLSYHKSELLRIRASIKDVGQSAHTHSLRSVTHTSLCFAMYPRVIATLIPGASKYSQLVENFTAVYSAHLSESEYAKLRAMSKAMTYTEHR
jgi:aryl-alcohol dehydrogenase-like predicted oxidoreductase